MSGDDRRINPFWENRLDNHAASHNRYADICDDVYGDSIQNINMTASYREISNPSSIAVSNHKNNSRDNVTLQKDDAHTATTVDHNNDVDNPGDIAANDGSSSDIDSPSKHNNNQTGFSGGRTSSKLAQRPASLVCDKSFPYNLEGTVSKDGDMTHFVAENLEFKIKLSSPVTKKDIGQQSSSSRISTPSASTGGGGGGGSGGTSLLPRQFLLSQQLPQIDSNVLNDIELEAQYLAASVDNLTENLCNLLHSISSITADNVEIHKNSVSKLTDSMDANIKSMYTIMAKTEEISKSMKPTEQLAGRIREIKRLVDMLESNL